MQVIDFYQMNEGPELDLNKPDIWLWSVSRSYLLTFEIP